MLIPIGILAAAGAGAAGGGSYELIETITVGAGGATSVTFSNLNTYNTTYQHIQIRWAARSTRSETNDTFAIRLNGDTAANYSWHKLEVDSSLVSNASTNASYGIFGVTLANTSPTGAFGAGVTEILDPFEATKYPTIRAFSGGANGSVRVGLTSSSWRNTTSLTSLTIFTPSGNLAQYSRFSLYGIKGA